MGGFGSGRKRVRVIDDIPFEILADELLRKDARDHLIDFVRYTKRDYLVSQHHRLVADNLEAVERGEINRLMVFMPPRHGKSELVSRKYPAWFIGRNPGKQVICAAYNSDLATEFGRDVRNTIADPFYRNIFNVNLRQDSKAADRWLTDNGGSYLAAGVGSGITGYGADLAVIDDPFKDRKEAESKTVRDSVWAWYRSTLYTRLMPGASVILCVTRWHEDDLAGRLLREQDRGGDQWNVVTLPALATGADILGRAEGDALWPQWFPLETLEKIRNAIGSYDWLSLYQQTPTSEEGNIFLKTWWRYYREVPDFDLVIQSWDTAFKDGADNDYSVCTTWGVHRDGFYLVDRFKEKLTFPLLNRALNTLAVRHKPHAILIEDKASGQSLIQELISKTTFPILPVRVDRDKVARAHAVTPLIEGGRVYLPEWASWVGDYLAEMSAFPRGAHDDDVDSTTQALNYLRDKGYGVQALSVDTIRDLDSRLRPILA